MSRNDRFGTDATVLVPFASATAMAVFVLGAMLLLVELPWWLTWPFMTLTVLCVGGWFADVLGRALVITDAELQIGRPRRNQRIVFHTVVRSTPVFARNGRVASLDVELATGQSVRVDLWWLGTRGRKALFSQPSLRIDAPPEGLA